MAEDNTPQPPFVFPVRIYWEDTDAGGIVFYANYLKFFERARTEWLRSLGMEQQSLRAKTGGMFVVTQTQLRFLQPARLDDVVHISTRLCKQGRASLGLHQQAIRQSHTGNTVLCEGSIDIAWVMGHALRPARIPSSLLELFA